MGHHFVPQRYLKGFQPPDNLGFIWMFDKLTQKSKCLPIKQVAQVPGFYEDEIEISLNVDVEIPGNDVIDKILAGKPIEDDVNDQDRNHLTYYIATMIRRVPHARALGQKFIPQTLVEVTGRVRQQLVDAEAVGLLTKAELEAKLAEADAWERKSQKEPPAEVRKMIETPWPFKRWLFAIHNMHWRVLRTEGPSYFLTNDNPAYFFEGFGLGHEECELILPLSTHLLLHCSWQAVKSSTVQTIPQQLVKELNRRIASGADRFVFYHKDADWVLKAALNQPGQLSRIRWS